MKPHNHIKIIMKYQADFTLCRLAAIAISKHLWKYSNLKHLLKFCIDEDSDPEDTMPMAIMSVMDNFNISDRVKEELVFAVGAMGLEIWELSEELTWRYLGVPLRNSMSAAPEPSSYVDYICWTNHGCIDLLETMRTLYTSKRLQQNHATWVELCISCLDDCITDLWPKLSNLEQFSNWKNRVLRSEVEYDAIISAYWIAQLKNDWNIVIRVFQTTTEQFYDAAYSIAENMFINSFVQQKYSAVKYFWGLLNENQKMRTIANICEEIISDNPRIRRFKELFFSRDELRVNLLMFFLEQLSCYGFDDVRIKILGSGFVLKQLLNWPYENSFWKTLEESWIYHDSINYNPIISAIFSNLCYHHQFIPKDVTYHRIFYEIWEMNPKNLKDSIDYHDALNILWGLKEIEILNHILGDEELKGKRIEFLERIAEIHDRGRTDMELLEEFMTKILDSEKEREWFGRLVALVTGEQL